MVRTDSTAWATQLRLLAPTVVRRLNEELGPDTVTVIEVLGPAARPGRRALARSATGAVRATPTAERGTPLRARQRAAQRPTDGIGTHPTPCSAAETAFSRR
ncbi:MAG: DciA family protein [Nocardioides sp.]